MLRVKTYIDKSKINGFGCFAAEPIKKGKIVWWWDSGKDRLIFEDEFPKNKTQREFIKKYGYSINGDWYLCIDNARFMNHSDTPNVNCLNGFDRALKNIRKGEEITCNYGQFCEDFKGFK